MNKFICFTCMLFLIGIVSSLKAEAPAMFRFESVQSIQDMQRFLQTSFPAGSSRENVRKVFVTDGGATLKLHPTRTGVEKYIYDINLCNYYIWRWNISADYDQSGKLINIYLNGLNDQRTQAMDEKALPGQKASIYKMQRPRPDANKGEKSLGYILFDKDSNPSTTDDQKLVGAGPSRTDPSNMGQMIAYANVDPWRSIFDSDNANQIISYAGNCAQVDAVMGKQK